MCYLFQGCPPTISPDEELETLCNTPSLDINGDPIPGASGGVTITYDYNSAAPAFNLPEGKATIPDAETCSKPCKVVFEEEFTAIDSDGVEYSVFPAHQYASSFTITDVRDLSTLSYTGGVSQGVTINLVIEVQIKYLNRTGVQCSDLFYRLQI